MKLTWKKIEYASVPGFGSGKNHSVQVKWDADTESPDEIKVSGFRSSTRRDIISAISKMLFGDGKPKFDELKDDDFYDESIEICNTKVFSGDDCPCPRCGGGTVSADMVFMTADSIDADLPEGSVGMFTWTIMCPECHLYLGGGFQVDKNFNTPCPPGQKRIPDSESENPPASQE